MLAEYYDPAPRIIQPRDPMYNLEVGVYLKPLEKKIFRLLTKMGQSGIPMVVKGFNAQETGRLMEEKWNRFSQPAAFGLDAVRFDQHVSVQALKWEHKIYQLFYPGDETLATLLKWQLVNKGRARCADGTVSYVKHGCRMSVDMNTSLGNCLIMCSIVRNFCSGRFSKWELANNGDDCIIIVERSEMDKFKGMALHCAQFGFEVEVEKPVFVFENIEFCQTHPVWTPAGYRMMRNYSTSLSKDGLSFLDLNTEPAVRRYMKAVGDGGLALTSGMPIMQEYYSAFIRNGMTSNMKLSVGWDTGFYRMGTGMEAKWVEVHPRTRASFYLAFGVTPQEQLSREDKHRRWRYVHHMVTYDASVPPTSQAHYDYSYCGPSHMFEACGNTPL